MPATDTKLFVRLPEEVKAFLKAEADANMRSMNSEVVIAIRERMERQQQETGQGAS